MLRSEGFAERALVVIDKEGIVRYVDIHPIDDQPDNEVLFGVLDGLEPRLAAAYHARIAALKSEPLPDADIVIYCTPWCPDCKKLRAYLQACEETYAEVDISRHREGARLAREWAGGRQVTPVIQIRGSEPIVDFEPREIEAALARLHHKP